MSLNPLRLLVPGLLGLAVTLGVPPARAAGLDVAGTATVSLGSGSMDLGCGNLSTTGTLDMDAGTLDNTDNVAITTSGTLNGDQGTLNMSGNWTNDGTFNAGTSTVNINDTCGSTSAITGNSTFNNLAITTTSGHEVDFGAGSTQTITGSVTLTGVSGNLLTIRSTTPGTPANLNLTGASPQTVSYLDLKDNHVTGLTTTPSNSIDSGNTLGWLFNLPIGPAAIPTLSRLGMLMLGLLLALSLLRRRRPERFKA